MPTTPAGWASGSPDALNLLDRQLLFVTGKGGVGKSTVAAALALLGAAHGKRTLVGEVDAKGNLADFLAVERTSFQPREVQPNLWAMSMDPEESLREYLQLQLRLPVMARIGPLNRIFEFVATAAPGVREVLTVGKFLWEADHGHYDLIVVDAAPTGHVVGQLSAPAAINELVQVGLIKAQTDWMVDILADPARTGVCIVATPEEMPVNETIELAARISAETSVDLAALVINRVLPELFGRGEEEVFERLTEDASDDLDRALGRDTGPLLTAARLAVTLRRTRAEHLERLRTSVDAAVPLLYVPELFARGHGLRTTRQVADALGAELGF